jgi:hypothetical protein
LAKNVFGQVTASALVKTMVTTFVVLLYCTVNNIRVNDQNIRTNDEAVTGPNTFFANVPTFEREKTNLRGTSVEYVKKSKINPP